MHKNIVFTHERQQGIEWSFKKSNQDKKASRGVSVELKVKHVTAPRAAYRKKLTDKPI